MDKSMIKGAVIGGLAMVVLGASAVTGYKSLNKPTFADVVAVKEITETVTTPRQHCENVQVQHEAPVKDSNRIAGTVVGGVAGGLLGSLVGGGNGKDPGHRCGRRSGWLCRQPGAKEHAA